MPRAPQVGILILNYHHPEETSRCVQRFLEQEPESTRVLWLENDADSTHAAAMKVLEQAPFPWVALDADAAELPPARTVGVIFIPENLGYAGGNNVGLRLLHRLRVPYAWVQNNDTLLLSGTSDLLVRAAVTRPEVGAWGVTIRAKDKGGEAHDYTGGVIMRKDFSVSFARSPQELESNPDSYVSGCSFFCRPEVLARIGFIPDDYFLYYEDPALSFELRKLGFAISGVPEVVIHHEESLSTGRRSPLMEFYNRRNRWFFIERYYPAALEHQQRRIWYAIQKYLFRLRVSRLYVECVAFRDYKARLLGRTHRTFSRTKRT